MLGLDVLGMMEVLKVPGLLFVTEALLPEAAVPGQERPSFVKGEFVR